MRVRAGGALLLLGVVLGGCPGGAELEDPDRFPQYPPVGTAAGSGAAPAAGTAGAGGASAGTSGSGSTAGASGTGVSCDITLAIKDNCLTGCHNATSHFANLDFSNVATIGMQMVDKPALHADVGCNEVGMLYRQCTPEELPALGCPPNALLIDSKNFEESWVVKKLNGQHANCGDPMPLPPGNSPDKGWGEARKTCFLEFFRSLAL